jgi:hypothetical protein
MGSGREALAGGSLAWARYAGASARRYDCVPVSMVLRRALTLDTVGYAHCLLGHGQ